MIWSFELSNKSSFKGSIQMARKRSIRQRSTFLAEFVGRDLKFKPQIQGLEWKIKGYKLSKADVIGHLSSSEGRVALEGLGEAKVRQYFPDYDIAEGLNISEIEAFVNSNYNTIFK